MTDEEIDKIKEVYFAIKRKGPLHNKDLVSMGLESEEHIRRITGGLESAGKIYWTKQGWAAN